MSARVLDGYEVLGALGSGAHSLVWQARKGGRHVALKEVPALHDALRAKRTYREIKLLQHFHGHDNIVALLDVFCTAPQLTFDAVCLVLEPMSTDLARQISGSGRPLDLTYRRLFTYQLLRALKAVHSAGVVHRDIKPQNVLINSAGELRLCDFGTGREVAEETSLNLTLLREVATPYYRPPEALLLGRYSAAVDLWGVGCILAEMIRRTPLFTSATPKEHLTRIANTVGPPSADVLATFPPSSLRAHLATISSTPASPLVEQLPHAHKHELELVTSLLAFDPLLRPSAHDALGHPNLSDLHDEDDEPSWPTFRDEDGDENADGDAAYWRALVWREVTTYRTSRKTTTKRNFDI